MRKRNIKEEHDNPDRWVVSYADFITLLFAFFTTMYAISHVDSGKLEKFAGSMKSAFKASGPGGQLSAVIEGIRPIDYSDVSLEKEVRAEFDKSAIIEGVTVSRDGRGVVISFEDSVLFESGEAELIVGARSSLRIVAEVVRKAGRPVVIEGHTDNIPMRHGRYGSNWELSTARAVSVLSRLVREHSLRPEIFSASGYGEFRPVASNATPAGRAKNRRVDIRLVNGTDRT